MKSWKLMKNQVLEQANKGIGYYFDENSENIICFARNADIFNIPNTEHNRKLIEDRIKKYHDSRKNLEEKIQYNIEYLKGLTSKSFVCCGVVLFSGDLKILAGAYILIGVGSLLHLKKNTGTLDKDSFTSLVAWLKEERNQIGEFLQEKAEKVESIAPESMSIVKMNSIPEPFLQESTVGIFPPKELREIRKVYQKTMSKK